MRNTRRAFLEIKHQAGSSTLIYAKEDTIYQSLSAKYATDISFLVFHAKCIIHFYAVNCHILRMPIKKTKRPRFRVGVEINETEAEV